MKNSLKVLALALILTMLSGCAFKTGDDLLLAPKPPKNYQALMAELKKVLDSDAEAMYASPESGENRNTVQLKDLDNDGEAEAIAFFRESNVSNRFTAYVYKKIGDTYIKTGTIPGSGTAIEAVDYPVLTPDGIRGIAISWRLASEGATSLTVCALRNGKVVPVLDTAYTSFEMLDLDADGAEELVTLSLDGKGKKVARMYHYDHDTGTMPLAGEAAITTEAQSIVRVHSGYVVSYQPAVFVEEKNESGVGLMTDIFVYDNNLGFRNIAFETGQTATAATYRPVSVYVSDINNDGLMEVPRTSLVAGYAPDAAEPLYLLDWYLYGGERPLPVCTTYHSQLENWMLLVPSAWHDSVTVKKSNTGSTMSCTAFAAYAASGEDIPLLEIWCLSGDTGQYFAQSKGMVTLAQSDTVIYTARIPDHAADSALAITMDDVKARFSLLTQEWAR